MNAPLVRLAAILVLGLPAASRGDEADKAGEKAKLVTRVYRVPASLFGIGSTGGPQNEKTPGTPGLESPPKVEGAPSKEVTKPLPPTIDGESRYDVWPWFEATTIERVPGSEAIFLQQSNTLVFTGSLEMHATVERFGYIGCGPGPLKLIEITASLWEYEDDLFADAVPGLRRFADIRKRGGGSLRLLDSQFVVTKSGYQAIAIKREARELTKSRAVSEVKAADAAQTEAQPRIDLGGARGSGLEVEPVVGPDGVLVDFTIRYVARLKGTGGARDTEIDVAAGVTLMSNHDAVPYCALAEDDLAPAKKGKVRRNALVIGVRLLDAEGLTREEGDKARAREQEELIRRARSGLGAPGK